MATVAGIKIKTKNKTPRNPLMVDEKYTGGEPVWDTERAASFDDVTFDHCLRKAFYYYNYYMNQKDCKKYVVEWMQNNEYSKEDVKSFIRASDKSIEMTACSLVMAHRQGMPFRGRSLSYLKDAIARSIKSADAEEVVVEVKDAVAKPYVPTIQDRLNEKTSELIGEIEGHYDDIASNVKSTFKPYDFFVANNVPQSQLSKYEAVYTDRRIELELAQTKDDAQLTEGYSHYKAADFKRIFAFIDQILSDIEQYRGVKKATKKVRAPRAVSKEKVVAKLKYAKEDKTLKLISINPADIVGAQELWVYNVKTRKLGKYVADQYKTLGVKGTSITGYNENGSVSKTLRKPADQLKEFAKAGKVALRTFIKDIKATETMLNGRISADVILLRAS